MTDSNQTQLKIANAPCSWGTLEFEGIGETQIGYEQMLDELVATGYTGTDLGDWGYMPTDPQALKSELQKRNLTMVGAFVPVDFKHESGHPQGEANALRTARLLAAISQADIASGRHIPFIVLADTNGSDPVRIQNAGRATSDIALNEAEWRTYAQGVDRVARAVKDQTGLRSVFHHHCAGYVETPAEIDRLMSLTDPDLVGLVFDTGHYEYGRGTNTPFDIQAVLDHYADRVWLVHYKDCHPGLAEQARREKWDYFTALRHGLFCELGQGAVDFASVTAWLQAPPSKQIDWIVVEQDVLPGLGSPKESAQGNRDYLRSLGL